MKTVQIPVSANFKKAAAKSFFALLFFAVSYSAIMVISLALATACILGGLFVAISFLSYLSIIVGAAIIGTGVLIAYFLLKFMFKLPKKKDMSHLIKITPDSEPELFALIYEVADQVGTKRPLNVYISGDVNASVFYNSPFWSMFFPVRKNLIIGLALTSVITREELKGILAHEFGHFSQRSMVFGSYIHNVNKILHNILYDNEDFNTWSASLASINQVFWFFVQIAVYILRAIQWVVQKIYVVLNTSYLELSREMEFHADHIAAEVVGMEPMQASLLRTSLGDYTFNQALQFYDGKIEENIKSANLFANHLFVFKYTAKRNQLRFKNNLPNVEIDDLKRYSKSKLTIKDRWDSHPSPEDRIASLTKTGLHSTIEKDSLANTVFTDAIQLQEHLTEVMYRTVVFKETPSSLNNEEFEKQYQELIANTTNELVFNGYFDDKLPVTVPLPEVVQAEELSFEELFAQEKVNWVYDAIALKNDIEAISNLKSQKIESFEYDGKPYNIIRALELINKLRPQLNELNTKINQNDLSIYQYFYRLAKTDEQKAQFKTLYMELNGLENTIIDLDKLYTRLSSVLNKIQQMNKFIDIRKELNLITAEEAQLKAYVSTLLAKETIANEWNDDITSTLTSYANETDKEYLVNEHRINPHLDGLYTAYHMVYRSFFDLKNKALLALTQEMSAIHNPEKQKVLELEEH